IVYVERCRSARPGQREIDLNLHVGARLPAYCTSLGKVLLAFLPADERGARLGGVELVRRGPNTLTSRRALTLELRRVRERGSAAKSEALASGLRWRAARVLPREGPAAAATNAAVHSSMISTGARDTRLCPPLLQTAADISARLGYRPA